MRASLTPPDGMVGFSTGPAGHGARRRSRLTWPDGAAVLGLLALTGLYTARFIDFSGAPYEDAAMLMRYAQHLAAGYGSVWNIGEPPVDGATDFLFIP